MPRRLAAPEPEHEIVVPVDDHLPHRTGGSVTLQRVPRRPLRVVVAEDDDDLAELIQSILDEDAASPSSAVPRLATRRSSSSASATPTSS